MKNRDLVFNQAYFFTGSIEDAEDITQEVFIRLWNNFKKIKPIAARSWALRVTKNLCIDHIRKKKAHISTTIINNESVDILETMPDTNRNPEEVILCNEIKENVHGLLALLPENLRNVVIMRDIQGLEYKLIAEIMEIPLNSIKVYLHRGRKLLAKYLMQDVRKIVEV